MFFYFVLMNEPTSHLWVFVCKFILGTMGRSCYVQYQSIDRCHRIHLFRLQQFSFLTIYVLYAVKTLYVSVYVQMQNIICVHLRTITCKQHHSG